MNVAIFTETKSGVGIATRSHDGCRSVGERFDGLLEDAVSDFFVRNRILPSQVYSMVQERLADDSTRRRLTVYFILVSKFQLEVEKVLRPFATLGELPDLPDNYCLYRGITVGDIRAARKLLERIAK